MMNALTGMQVARVGYNRVAADAAFAALRVLPEIKGPGWSQADAVQAVTQLAIARTDITTGNLGPFVVFTRDHKIRRIEQYVWNPTKVQREILDSGGELYALHVMGSPEVRSRPAGRGLPKDYGRLTALAIDGITYRVADAEQGPNVPVGFQDISQTVALGVGVVAVLVTGAALAVIGGVAAWRYLEPSLRRDIATIREASRHYEQRLAVLGQTGTLPDPSPIELGAVETIERAAEEGARSHWIDAALVGGGAAGATLLAGVLSK